jgi:hypothetical protein
VDSDRSGEGEDPLGIGTSYTLPDQHVDRLLPAVTELVEVALCALLEFLLGDGEAPDESGGLLSRFRAAKTAMISEPGWS